MGLNIFKPGGKVDIRLLQQGNQDGKISQVLKSQIYDVDSNEKVDLYMPMDGTKYVLLPLNLRYEFMFYTDFGLYRCEGKVAERFKSNNTYIISIVITSQPSKYQRREYYRYPCLMNLNYYKLTQELTADLDPKEDEIQQVEERIKEANMAEKTGFVMDISGGGIRFITKEKFVREERLLMYINLQSKSIHQEYCLIGSVVNVVRLDTPEEKYQIRVQFEIKDVKIREEIIRFIFEEERKNRQKKG